jgi:hypothetical protein
MAGKPLTALTPEQRVRRARLCGMLGSDFDGERANAAFMANRLVRSLGLTWEDVLSAAGDQAERSWPGADPDPGPRAATPREQANFCLDSGVDWNAWELEFLVCGDGC